MSHNTKETLEEIKTTGELTKLLHEERVENVKNHIEDKNAKIKTKLNQDLEEHKERTDFVKVLIDEKQEDLINKIHHKNK